MFELIVAGTLMCLDPVEKVFDLNKEYIHRLDKYTAEYEIKTPRIQLECMYTISCAAVFSDDGYFCINSHTFDLDAAQIGIMEVRRMLDRMSEIPTSPLKHLAISRFRGEETYGRFVAMSYNPSINLVMEACKSSDRRGCTGGDIRNVKRSIYLSGEEE